ncbi:hemoglobin [[Phormidium] sp. ETS-05]|uniref:hemoglobin n=1 Tax=[Phormidium] sp. ETS-05 TaxID=222819 RepID=UPI001E4AFFFA|nr:hemoglobin [[Phormidium] sp. ETS-05]
MRNAHKRLVEQMNLNDQHFDAVAENLAATLEELGVAPDMVQEVLGLVETLRNDVLSR